MSDYLSFTRSIDSWGTLANVPDDTFNRILNGRQDTHKNMKDLAKKQKKLKTYNVTFTRELISDQFEIMAENEYDLSSKARQFFKDNAGTIGFKETRGGQWSGDGYTVGYDRITYVRMK